MAEKRWPRMQLVFPHDAPRYKKVEVPQQAGRQGKVQSPTIKAPPPPHPTSRSVSINAPYYSVWPVATLLKENCVWLMAALAFGTSQPSPFPMPVGCSNSSHPPPQPSWFHLPTPSACSKVGVTKLLARLLPCKAVCVQLQPCSCLQTRQPIPM